MPRGAGRFGAGIRSRRGIGLAGPEKSSFVQGVQRSGSDRHLPRTGAPCDYALHLGLTEAGMGSKGIVASTAALAVLLQEALATPSGSP